MSNSQYDDKSIALITTGGTISSEYDGNAIKQGKVTGFNIKARKVLTPYSILSENIQPENIALLISAINQGLSDCDAVIITHGTDTLVHSAAFLSLYYAGVKKPILLVSSDFPLSDKRANGHINLLLAQNFLKQYSGGGVFVPYKNKGEKACVHAGNRLLFPRAFDGKLYSALDKVVAKLNSDGTLKIYEKNLPFNFLGGRNKILNDYLNLSQEEKFKDIKDNLGKLKIRFFTAFPGMDFEEIATDDFDDAATVIEGYHSGTVCTFGKNSAAAISGKTYLLGGIRGAKYESLAALSPKVTIADNITPAAFINKLKLAACLAMCEKNNFDDFLFTNISGEFF